MDGQPTRAGLPPEDAPRQGGLPLPAEWRRFFAFLRSPTLPDRAETGVGGTLRMLAPLYALDIALMVLVIGGIGLASALGFEMPDHVLQDFAIGPGLLAIIVLGAPIAEELIFRGWVSGRPGHVLSVALVLAGIAGGMMLTEAAMRIAVLGAALVGAILALVFLRGRPAMSWFQRRFGFFFYASALAFAGVHVLNFAGASPALLPLVLPQLLLGMILAYLRVYRGIAAGMTLHALHNGLFALGMLAGASGG